MYATRKDFLKAFMKMTGISTMKEADRLAQAMIGLIKAGIDPELSEKIASSVPQDLGLGWRKIALPSEAMELQEMMNEIEGVGETPPEPADPRPPEYG